MYVSESDSHSTVVTFTCVLTQQQVKQAVDAGRFLVNLNSANQSRESISKIKRNIFANFRLCKSYKFNHEIHFPRNKRTLLIPKLLVST